MINLKMVVLHKTTQYSHLLIFVPANTRRRFKKDAKKQKKVLTIVFSCGIIIKRSREKHKSVTNSRAMDLEN